MERKIGEIFKYNGEWYQCLPERRICDDCAFKNDITCKNSKGIRGECQRASRQKDGIIFKKLEKVGEPYRRWFSPFNNIMVQRYRLYGRNVIMPDEPIMLLEPNYKNSVEIEIKQNKEDMKEKKLNLKTFDLEAAKSGKPVCTRDGRKARIICYDRQSDHGFPLVVLVENTGAEKDEDIRCYRLNGATAEPSYDLMMSPERHEGWVNVFNHGNNDTYVGNIIFPTEKLAKEAASRMNGVKYIATVKIEWEE